MPLRYNHLNQQDAEDSLYHILNTISEGIWDWNAINGHVKRSAGWYRMLGFDPDSIAGRIKENVFTWENTIHPDDYERVMAHFEDYVTGRTSTYKIQYRCKTARDDYLWIEDYGSIVERDDEGQVTRMIGAHTNIHDQKTAQIELQRQNKPLDPNRYKQTLPPRQNTA